MTPAPEISGPQQPLGSLEEWARISSQQCCPLGKEAAATPRLPARALAEPEAPGVWHPWEAGVGRVVLGPKSRWYLHPGPEGWWPCFLPTPQDTTA